MDPDDKAVSQELRDRFQQLPKVVQNAITSADVQKHLRELAETHKLHLDQWQLLENEVMMTLLGFQAPEELQGNIKTEVGVDDATALALAGDVSKIVFEPIREELERQLEHPEAKAEALTGAETARRQILQTESGAAAPPAPVPAPTVAPGTPPAPAPDAKTVRAPVSEVYKAGETSTERKTVHDDPYREPPA